MNNIYLMEVDMITWAIISKVLLFMMLMRLMDSEEECEAEHGHCRDKHNYQEEYEITLPPDYHADRD